MSSRCWLGVLVVLLAVGVLASAAHAASMTHGPIVGAVTDTTAAVWVRTDMSARVQVRYTTNAVFDEWWVSGVDVTASRRDFTVTVPLAGTSPVQLSVGEANVTAPALAAASPR